MDFKIPFYHVLNMLLTGVIFIVGVVFLYPSQILSMLQSLLYEELSTMPEIIIMSGFFAIAYEVGLIINRIGSICIEFLLKKWKLIPFNDDYLLFNKKKKEYPNMEILSREYALSRTGISLFSILFLLSLFEWRLTYVGICVIAVLIYYYSCKKHALKIVEIMNETP